jgi:hypothetical protein
VQGSGLWQGSTFYTERAAIGGALLRTKRRQLAGEHGLHRTAGHVGALTRASERLLAWKQGLIPNLRPLGEHCFVQESASGSGTGAHTWEHGYNEIRPVGKHCSTQESGHWQGSTVYRERVAIGGSLPCTRESRWWWHGSMSKEGTRFILGIQLVGDHCSVQDSGFYRGALFPPNRRPLGEHCFFAQQSARGRGMGARLWQHGLF